MATRSLIAVWDDNDRQIQARYCHSDGYPEYNGAILQGNYRRPAAAQALMDATSDFSYISAALSDCKVYEESEPAWVSHTDNYMSELLQLANSCGAEWVYLYVKNKWYVAQNTSPFKFLPLKAQLEALENPVAKEYKILA